MASNSSFGLRHLFVAGIIWLVVIYVWGNFHFHVGLLFLSLATMFYGAWLGRAWITIGGPVICCVLAISGFDPAGPKEPAFHGECSSRLRQIGIALHMYHDHYGSFPPAYVADEDGEPMHSWRVLLLPFLQYGRLYERYRLDEPWESRHNFEVTSEMPDVYRCPDFFYAKGPYLATQTNYLAVTGPGTAWPGTEGSWLSQFEDGTWQTILVVEEADSGVHWAEPRDLSTHEFVPRLNMPHGRSISSYHPGGAHVCYADGSVEFLEDDTPPDLLRALLTLAGKETLPADLYGY